MTSNVKNSVVAAAIGAVFLASSGAIAFAQSSDMSKPSTEKTRYAGKQDRKHHSRHHGGKRRGNMMRMLRAADLDKNGSITQEELDTYRADQAAKADANGDGNISIGEFETIWLIQTQRRMVRAFQRLDTDGDGLVTKEERDEPFAKLIERLDRNGDGQLNRDDRGHRGKHHRSQKGNKG